ncbi:MAG: response regulator [Candidatus Mcinerneyibacterium aminivorans]|uniref:histidine kinase n=1 Tax=Candidatus Mcinerneyibacterium aminivorans TaxID=2703815 RepID=A0A5D0MK48_9BACT|nr:MAG: response regulator [Candidatus Mcinerneyibacterium aminivorans]
MFNLNKIISKMNLKRKISLIILAILIPLIVTLLIAVIIYSNRVFKVINRSNINLTGNVYNALNQYKLQTIRYSATISENSLIQRAVYYNDTGVLLNYFKSLMVELNVGNIIIHNKNGKIIAQGYYPEKFNIMDKSKYFKKAIAGNRIFAIDRINNKYLFFTTSPIYHSTDKNLAVGTITVEYEINNEFMLKIKNLAGTHLIFMDEKDVVTSSFGEIKRENLLKNFKKLRLGNIKYDLIEIPVKADQQTRYLIYAAIDNSIIKNSLTNFILFLLFIFVAAMALGITLALKIANNINNSKNKILAFTEEISKNNYNTRVEIDTEDEFKMLASTFNKMADNIKNNFGRIEKQRDEIRLFKNYLSGIIDSMPSLLISINKKGEIKRWNKAVTSYTGIKSEKVKGAKIGSIIPMFKRYLKYIDDVIENNKTFSFSRERFGNEEIKYFDINLFPVKNESYCEMLIRADDVTEMHNKDMELKQIQKMETVGNLASGFAHDLNNILGGIVGILSILEYKIENEKNISRDELGDRVKSMINISRRAEDLINKLLTLARKKEMKFLPVDINEIIENVVGICTNSFNKKINIEQKLSKNRILINADSTQIEQAILNICINSEHAMTIMKGNEDDYGGTLSIEVELIESDKYFVKYHPKAEVDSHYCIVSVSDNGVGMDAETQNKIFEPFFTSKEKMGGTGLGLTMVYNIISQHNGFIEIYSEIDEGTSFNVYLPVMEKPFDKSKIEKESIVMGEGTVLVVDDESIMREVAGSILKECNYNVIKAKDGKECLDIYRANKERINCILLDYGMPIMTGKEVFQKLKEIDKDVKVILTSGSRKEDKMNSLGENYKIKFLKKPFTLRKLSKIVAEILEIV